MIPAFLNITLMKNLKFFSEITLLSKQQGMIKIIPTLSLIIQLNKYMQESNKIRYRNNNSISLMSLFRKIKIKPLKTLNNILALKKNPIISIIILVLNLNIIKKYEILFVKKLIFYKIIRH